MVLFSTWFQLHVVKCTLKTFLFVSSFKRNYHTYLNSILLLDIMLITYSAYSQISSITGTFGKNSALYIGQYKVRFQVSTGVLLLVPADQEEPALLLLSFLCIHAALTPQSDDS